MFWRQKKQNSDERESPESGPNDSVADPTIARKVANADPSTDSSLARQESQTSVEVNVRSKRGGYIVPRGYTIRGNPCCSGAVTIYGSVEGVTRASEVHIAPTGRLDGSSVAEFITVEGSAKSNLVATKRLVLLPGSQVAGRIQTPVIEISATAQIVNAEMRIG